MQPYSLAFSDPGNKNGAEILDYFTCLIDWDIKNIRLGTDPVYQPNKLLEGENTQLTVRSFQFCDEHTSKTSN